MVMYNLRNVNHFITGIFLILVSLLAFYLSRRLSMFTEIGLGSGFIPRMLASIQLLFGFILVASGFLTVGEPGETWRLRPLIVLAAIVFFGITLESMGLLVAVTGLVLMSCAANNDVRPVEALGLAVGSAVFSALLFVKALGLSIPVWPQNLLGV
jgi:putative tricarboxylic transport membrane protein